MPPTQIPRIDALLCGRYSNNYHQFSRESRVCRPPASRAIQPPTADRGGRTHASKLPNNEPSASHCPTRGDQVSFFASIYHTTIAAGLQSLEPRHPTALPCLEGDPPNDGCVGLQQSRPMGNAVGDAKTTLVPVGAECPHTFLASKHPYLTGWVCPSRGGPELVECKSGCRHICGEPRWVIHPTSSLTDCKCTLSLMHGPYLN